MPIRMVTGMKHRTFESVPPGRGLDRRNLLVVKEERVSPAGDIEATMQFDDYRAVGDLETAGAVFIQERAAPKRILRPFAIHMTDGQGSGSLHVTFIELIPNQPIKPSELGRV